MAHKSSTYSELFELVSVNLQNQDEVEELMHQRRICGWNYHLEAIRQWQSQIEQGFKFMWWITTTPLGSERATRAGHVTLAAEAFPPDPELAQLDRSILTVSLFFILPQHRKGGLGRAVWYEVENKARVFPECTQIAIDTLDRRYAFDDGPEWGGFHG